MIAAVHELEPRGETLRLTHVESSEGHWLIYSIWAPVYLKLMEHATIGYHQGLYCVQVVPVTTPPKEDQQRSPIDRSREHSAVMLRRNDREELQKVHDGMVENCQMGLMENFVRAIVQHGYERAEET